MTNQIQISVFGAEDISIAQQQEMFLAIAEACTAIGELHDNRIQSLDNLLKIDSTTEPAIDWGNDPTGIGKAVTAIANDFRYSVAIALVAIANVIVPKD